MLNNVSDVYFDIWIIKHKTQIVRNETNENIENKHEDIWHTEQSEYMMLKQKLVYQWYKAIIKRKSVGSSSWRHLVAFGGLNFLERLLHIMNYTFWFEITPQAKPILASAVLPLLKNIENVW